MAGIVKGEGDAGQNLSRPVVAQPHEVFQTFDGIFHVVDGLNWRQMLAFAARIQVANILFLNLGAVAQHDGAQVAGGVGADNVAAEAAFDQVGDVTAVVDVGV